MDKRTKTILWISVGILLFMFLPIIIPFTYQFIMGLKGVSIHEGNSAVFSLFWYSFLTIPIGIIGFIILLIGTFISERNRNKHRDHY